MKKAYQGEQEKARRRCQVAKGVIKIKEETCHTCKFGEEGVCYNCYGANGVTEIGDKGSCRNYEKEKK